MFLGSDSGNNTTEDNILDLVNTLVDLTAFARENLPKSRAAALTLTKLEEALMWAQKIEEDR